MVFRAFAFLKYDDREQIEDSMFIFLALWKKPFLVEAKYLLILIMLMKIVKLWREVFQGLLNVMQDIIKPNVSS